MKPPPDTPTPRRFLTKRPATSSSQPTPTPMRFQSTPRFGATQGATRGPMEDVEEADAGVSGSQGSSEEPDGWGVASDSIEVDSDGDSLVSREEKQEESRSSALETEEEEDGESGGARRQRDYLSGLDDDDEEDVAAEVAAEYTDTDATTPPAKRRRLSSSASPSLGMAAAYDSEAASSEERYDSEQECEEHDDVQDRTRTRPPAQEPTFRPAPRFKPASDDELLAAHEHHDRADATTLLVTPSSSPPRARRGGGAKYITGGLAAQLQGLLSQVKGGAEGDDEGVTRLRVEEFRLGRRMHLVRGRVLEAKEEGEVRRFILAGGGGRMEGGVLRIGRAPAWDVRLGDQEWTVACNWNVEPL